MKRTICYTLALLLVFFACAGCNENKISNSEVESIEETTFDHTAFENLVFDQDLVEISELNGVVKIDSITAGFDSFSFDTILLDLESGEKLCELSFSDGAWFSGLTEKGFYAVDTLKKELKIYDRKGNVTKEITFSDVGTPVNFCALSENETYFLYANPPGTQITVMNLSDNGKTDIDIESPPRDTLSFKDNVLRAVSVDGNVFEMNVSNSDCRFVLIDNRIKLFSSKYCLGETETNFLLASKDACYYIPISSADEIVIGMGENGFATTTFSENEYKLRFYDLLEKRVSYYVTKEPIERICYTQSGRILAVVGSAMEKRHELIECKPENGEPLTVLSRDTVVNKEENNTTSETVQTTPKHFIKNVPVIAQFPEYPTGCESVSAVMALQYSGYSITVEEFTEQFLPTSREFYIENGKNYGPNPYEYFIGNPKSASSYGCMAPVIETAITQYIGDSSRVKNVTDMELSRICEQYINRNVPVIVWATIHMLETKPVNSWYLASDGTRFTWPGNEHCMLLVGYDDENYYFNDPYAGRLVAYKKQLTEDRFAEMGRQALVVLPS